jgi:hypothetical protein
LAEVERLAFIAPGECTLLAFGPPVVCANAEALLVDRFEVTRDRWRRWCDEENQPLDPLHAEFISRWTPDTDPWPATFMSLAEARAFAASRGMRLLSGREWMRIASGTRRSPWPWGQSRANSVANTLELELGRPVAVGTFEQGRTPLGTYEMLGNVWEWVDEPILGRDVAAAVETGWALECAMGGSYLSKQERLYQLDTKGRLSFFQQDLDARSRSIDLGLRCGVEAETYLWSKAGEWGGAAGARERLRSVGVSWGRDSIAVLEKLAARPGAARELEWLLEGARR